MLLQRDPMRTFDRLTEQLFADTSAARSAPMDVYRSGDHYVLHVDLPGIDRSSVDVSVHDNVLTIRASRPARGSEGVQYLVAERPSGEFARRLVLGTGLDLSEIAATYDAGVLTVTIPVAEAAKPRRIQVGTASEPTVIESRREDRVAVGSGG